MRSHMLKILPPVWFAIFVASALVLQYAFPVTRVFDYFVPLYSALVSLALFVFGFGLSLRASNIFAIEKTEILPTSPTNRVLITRGPYKWSRNPMYLGMVLTILGMAVYIGTLPMYVAAVLHFMVLNFVFIPYEEEKLERLFGESYLEYKKTVRRWL